MQWLLVLARAPLTNETCGKGETGLLESMGKARKDYRHLNHIAQETPTPPGRTAYGMTCPL